MSFLLCGSFEEFEAAIQNSTESDLVSLITENGAPTALPESTLISMLKRGGGGASQLSLFKTMYLESSYCLASLIS